MPKQKLDPLPSAAFQILLALAGEDLHGYAIMRSIAEQTGGHMCLGPGRVMWASGAGHMTSGDIYARPSLVTFESPLEVDDFEDISKPNAAPQCMSKLLLALVITMVIVLSTPAASQTVVANPDHYGGMLHATAAHPSFDAATIRPSAPNAELRFRGITMQPGGIKIRGSSMEDVIEFAYGVPSHNELFGGPSWIQTEKFDIMAKPDEAETLRLGKLSNADLRVQMQLMVQSLLEERLHLKVSFAMKDLPLFALVVAKGGFKCTNAAPDAPPASIQHPRHDADGPLPPPPPPLPPGYVPPTLSYGPGHEQAMSWMHHGWPFSLIVAWITRQPELGGRMVVDKTGLDGIYDCDLSWVPEGADVPGPSFFTAVEEQMGLRLQSEKGPVETMIIDHIEQPSEN